MTWGMVCCFSGVMDSIYFIDRAVKSHMFGTDLPWMVNLISFVIASGPITELCIAYCIYTVYKEATNPGSSYGSGGIGSASGGSIFGSSGAGAGANAGYGSVPTTTSGGTGVATFKPFAGAGNVLGQDYVEEKMGA